MRSHEVYVNRVYPSGPNTPDVVSRKYEALLLKVPDKPTLLSIAVPPMLEELREYTNLPKDVFLTQDVGARMSAELFIKLASHGLIDLAVREKKSSYYEDSY